jgi:holo-[acyl-carrier protein] synthase
MIGGIGMDVVDVTGFRDQLADTASTFVQGTFTSGEQERVETRPSPDRVPHLAVRFAAKEAFIKAWSTANTGRIPALKSVDMREIEVVQDAHGRPALRLHGAVNAAYQTQDLGTVHLSLSHDGDVAAAFVVVERPANG